LLEEPSQEAGKNNNGGRKGERGIEGSRRGKLYRGLQRETKGKMCWARGGREKLEEDGRGNGSKGTYPRHKEAPRIGS